MKAPPCFIHVVSFTLCTLFWINPASPAPAATLTTLVEFSGGSLPNTGAYPYGGLVQAGDGNFYGTTSGVGYDYGTVFRMTPAGLLTTLVAFTDNGEIDRGRNPMSGLVRGADGNLYGTTGTGGTNYSGTVFRITLIGVLTTVADFDGVNGYEINAVMQAGDGNFYGTTYWGGANGFGNIFRMTPAGVLTSLVDFAGTGTSIKGNLPRAGLLQANDGNFYGTTEAGGADDLGTVFRMTPAGALTTLVEFSGNGASNKGKAPYAGLVQASDGDFYGTTYFGGTDNYGTVFRMTPVGALTTLVEFSGNGASNKGSHPYAGLVQASDGNFYGTTGSGGASGNGTIFRMTPAGALTTLVEFTRDGASNRGTRPRGALVQGSDGNLYGTTAYGGANNYGTVFKLDIGLGVANAAPTNLTLSASSVVENQPPDTVIGILAAQDPNAGDSHTFSFVSGLGDTDNGSFRLAGHELRTAMPFDFETQSTYSIRVRATDTGGLFCEKQFTINVTDVNEVLTTLIEFTGNGAANKGICPGAGLILSSDGNFYGMTQGGGANSCGTVFRMTPDGVLTTLVEFTGNGVTNKGGNPVGLLVQSTDGHFYGTTYYGGAGNLGTIFRMTAGGVLTTLLEFTGNGETNKGSCPGAGLVQASDGSFYGTTVLGGAKDYGTVFRITSGGVLTTLVEFTGAGVTNRGRYPEADLVRASDGNFYGTTQKGGTDDLGTVFRMTPSGVLTTLVEFTGAGVTNRGSYPEAGLVQTADGNFYGSTWWGGSNDCGTTFRITSSGVLTTLVEFTINGASNKGSCPGAVLVLASDGNFYGTTVSGGALSYGTIFRMTPDGVLTTLVEFTDYFGTTKGAHPRALLVQAGNGDFYGLTADGGTDDYGTVFKLHAGLPPANTRPCLGISGLVNGQFGLTFSCRAGQSYQIQASTNLQQWITVHSNTATGATFQFADTNSPSFPQRFYRTTSP